MDHMLFQHSLSSSRSHASLLAILTGFVLQVETEGAYAHLCAGFHHARDLLALGVPNSCLLARLLGLTCEQQVA